MVRRRSQFLFLIFVGVGTVMLLVSYFMIPQIDRNLVPGFGQNSVHDRLISLEQELEENQQLLSHVRRKIIQVSRTIRRKGSIRNVTSGCQSVSPLSNADISSEEIYEEISFDNDDGGVWKQGWPITIDPIRRSGHRLQVFVVPHSHNDPGWIKTFDNYFKTQTRHILNSMLSFLPQNPSMKFIWAGEYH
jgi:alpha-mannosidase II